MNLTLDQLVKGEAVLSRLATVKLPIKVSYKISRLLSKVTAESKIYHEKRFDLIKEMGSKVTPESDSYTVKPENMESFASEIKKLGEVEVELDWDKIKVEDLGLEQIEPSLLIDWLFE